MRLIQVYRRRFVLAVAFCLASATLAVAAEPELTKDQIKKFLLTAKVVGEKTTKKGITEPALLTLSDGKITHQAVFQPVDIHKATFQFADGHTELNFVDSYKYNIAGYILSELLGMDDMIPIHVERKYKGTLGSLSWLVPVMMDEQDRQAKKMPSPNSDAWNKQMFKIRVFDELVYDTDPNLTNVLIGPDWKIWRVDFSRAFRIFKDVKDVKNLDRCERKLFEKLKVLDGKEFAQKTKNLLNKNEVDTLMARRDKIVAYIQKRIVEKGENEVLY